MTIGTLMEIGNCQKRGQVSQNSLYWMKNHLMDIHGLGRDWQESKRAPDQTFLGQKFGQICQKRRSEEKSKSFHQNTVYWANLRVAHKKRLTFYQKRSNVIILHNALPAACIEKVVAMSSGEVFTAKSCTRTGLARRTNGYYKHWRERESIQRPFQQVLGHICCGENDYRIQGLPHSTGEQEDHTRKEVVK